MNRRHFLLASLAAGTTLALPAAASVRPRPTRQQILDDLRKALDAGARDSAPLLPPTLNVHALRLDGLSDKARAVGNKKFNTTLLQLDFEVIAGQPDWTRPQERDDLEWLEHLTCSQRVEPCARCVDRADREFVRVISPCVYFSKVCDLGLDGQPPPQYIEAVVRVFGRLVDAGVLGYGVLVPPSWILARPEVPGLEWAERPVRAMLFFYAFPSLPWLRSLALEDRRDSRSLPEELRAELNAVVGNVGFVCEGDVGNDDWSNLL